MIKIWCALLPLCLAIGGIATTNANACTREAVLCPGSSNQGCPRDFKTCEWRCDLCTNNHHDSEAKVFNAIETLTDHGDTASFNALNVSSLKLDMECVKRLRSQCAIKCSIYYDDSNLFSACYGGCLGRNGHICDL